MVLIYSSVSKVPYFHHYSLSYPPLKNSGPGQNICSASFFSCMLSVYEHISSLWALDTSFVKWGSSYCRITVRITGDDMYNIFGVVPTACIYFALNALTFNCQFKFLFGKQWYFYFIQSSSSIAYLFI